MKYVFTVILLVVFAIGIVLGQPNLHFRKHIQNAAVLLANGEDTKAARKLDDAIASAPKQFSTYKTVVDCLLQFERYDAAAEYAHFTLEVAQAPNYLNRNLTKQERIVILRRLSIAIYNMGDPFQAARVGETALALEPNNSGLMNDVGYFYAESGRQLQRAVSLTSRAVAAVPNQGMFLDSLGWAYYKLGRYEQAEAYLKRAVAFMPNEPEIRCHLGILYSKWGKRTQAKLELSKVLILRPDYVPAISEMDKLSPTQPVILHNI